MKTRIELAIIHLLIISLFTVPLLSSCSSKTNPKNLDLNQAKQLKLESCRVINACLSSITPHSFFSSLLRKNSSLNLYIVVEEKMLLLDQSTIDEFLAKGVDSMVQQLLFSKSFPLYLKPNCLEPSKVVNYTFLSPMAPKEQQGYCGGMNFSRVCFSEDQTKALVVYHYSYLHMKEAEKFGLIELTKKESWEIVRVVELNEPAKRRLLDKENS